MPTTSTPRLSAAQKITLAALAQAEGQATESTGCGWVDSYSFLKCPKTSARSLRVLVSLGFVRMEGATTPTSLQKVYKLSSLGWVEIGKMVVASNRARPGV